MRVRLLFLFLLMMTGGLLSLGLPLARGVAADEAQNLQLDRLQDVVRFASLAQPRADGADERVAEQVLTAQIERYTQLYGIDVAVLDPSGKVYLGSLGPAADEDSAVQDPGSAQKDGRSSQIRSAASAALAGRIGEGPPRLWPWDDDPFVVAQPMVSDGDVVGAVLSVSAATAARSRVLTEWAVLAGIGLAALLLAMALAARLAVWVLRPIRMLESAAHGIAGGEFGTRVAGEAGPPELRHLASTFNEMAERVQAVLAAQRTFVADASHQLRNPLNALLLRLEMLRSVTRSAEASGSQRAAAAQLAVREGNNLAATLDRMLELARAEHATADPEPVDVAAVVDDRLASWSVLATRRSICLRRDGDLSAIGWQDPVALAGAVDAVVDNALKYSPEGGTVTVLVSRRPDGWVSTTVTDTGPGMSPADLARAGERFWRSDPGPGSATGPGSSRGQVPTGGSGLGLSIAAELLQRHGGRLVVRPAGQGEGLCAELLVAPFERDEHARKGAHHI